MQSSRKKWSCKTEFINIKIYKKMYILFTTFNDENKYYNLNLQILPEILLAAYCHLLFCLSAFV